MNFFLFESTQYTIHNLCLILIYYVSNVRLIFVFLLLVCINIVIRTEEVKEARLDYNKEVWEPTLEKKKKR